MKYIKYLLIGILFGIVMTKSEAISWFRIQEMFRFESFHMYGIFAVAIACGILMNIILKKLNVKTYSGDEIKYTLKDNGIPSLLIGGTIFGLGWAITGACPGPMFVLLGHGVWSILIVILSAILGTFVYGILKKRLPH